MACRVASAAAAAGDSALRSTAVLPSALSTASTSSSERLTRSKMCLSRAVDAFKLRRSKRSRPLPSTPMPSRSRSEVGRLLRTPAEPSSMAWRARFLSRSFITVVPPGSSALVGTKAVLRVAVVRLAGAT